MSDLAVQTMARRLTESWSTVPHFYLMRDVHAARLVAWREQLRERLPQVTYSDLLIKLASGALRDHPRMRGLWKEGQIHVSSEVHVGLAVAVEDGIVVPVIRRSDQLTAQEITSQRRELLTRAREGRLRSEDVSDGVFTISNLGMYGVDGFLAIVNPPQAAILAVGRIADRVVAVNGRPDVQPMMTLSLCCDHRVVDGARGAEFLTTLADRIEEPSRWME